MAKGIVTKIGISMETNFRQNKVLKSKLRLKSAVCMLQNPVKGIPAHVTIKANPKPGLPTNSANGALNIAIIPHTKKLKTKFDQKATLMHWSRSSSSVNSWCIR